MEAVHLAAEVNVVVKCKSRGVRQRRADRPLNLFSKIQEHWDMNTNSFVAPWNTQLQNFVSWKSQPEEIAANAFQLNGIALNVTLFSFFINFYNSRSEKPQTKRDFSATATRLSYPSPTDATSESHYGGTRHATLITPIRCTLTWRLESLRGFYSLQRFLTLVIGLQLEKKPWQHQRTIRKRRRTP